MSAFNPETFQQNAGYCWFHRERGLTIGDVTIFGNVAGESTADETAGDLRISTFNHRTGATTCGLLGNFSIPDDHNAPALCCIGNDVILAMWQGHGHENLIRYRRFDTSGTPVSEEASVDVGAGAAYSNVFKLPQSSTVLDLHRGVGTNPNYIISHSDGEEFVYGGRLIKWDRPATKDNKYTGLDGARPYVIYGQAGTRIHFAAVEDHPRAYDNSVYHGYIEDGAVFDSYGNRAGSLPTGRAAPTYTFDTLTKVFDGDANAVAWVSDITASADGTVTLTFSVQKSGAATRAQVGVGGDDLRYYYACFDGQRWTVFEIAYAGTCLYPGEDDYSGLVSINPDNPLQIALSANHCPVTNALLLSKADGRRHYEVFLGLVDLSSQSVRLSAVTSDSTEDNIRPTFTRRVEGDANALFWMAGQYRSYTDFATRVVGFKLTS